MTAQTSVGFIGLGAMGAPMATNLVRAGFDVTVHNRTAAKARPLADAGAAVADTPAGVAAGGVVITMLADDAAVRAVTLGEDGIVGRLGEGGLHVMMSTVAAETSHELARRHAEHGEQVLVAPVFGRPDMAEAAKLNICVSGDDDAKARARPFLDAMGVGVWDFGEEFGAANIVKLAGNFMIAAASEAMGEAYTLCEGHGIDRNSVHELLSSTLFASPVHQGYGARIAARTYQPAGFPMPLGLKDLTLAGEAAAQARVPMPLADLCRQRLIAGIAHGREDWDWAGLAQGVSDDAGRG
ncbi:NAD(P)-dependent oxidoreductase [Arhodomonas aquaeolei]|uniref:NAD(P)-dependent oxidoreductase n=1 Tax=Arhodomonas aquaeolei TaxID=2369 RepID=UPI000372BC15|nr:NAD(P)-dependent oxidoreductase [Arhodomonas aquaeolei]